MPKHVPVLLNEVLVEFDKVLTIKDNPVVLDCTLGQAGHSYELFKRMEKGVLISIDLDSETIQWVIEYFNDELLITNEEVQGKLIYQLTLKDSEIKKWYILQYDFAKLHELPELLDVKAFDFILADLGFSNYQLTRNKGISFDKPSQRLDMRYEQNSTNSVERTTDSGPSAAEVLNTFSANDLESILKTLGQIEYPEKLVAEIVESRKEFPFEKVSDIVRILNKPKFPKGYKFKFFQALRSFVNKENERLVQLIEMLSKVLSPGGNVCVITFNSIEEGIIESLWDRFEVKEPNITEIIKNKQSRSAKLYTYKKDTHQVPKEEQHSD
jgi:16S rRNA (cytosine1402-N4)-methyltransferase